MENLDIMAGKNCRYRNNQKIVNNNHVKTIDGEIKRVCPICFASLQDTN